MDILKTMDNGKILSGTSFSHPSLSKGCTLSLTMIIVAALSLIACTSKPDTATLTNASRSVDELGRRVIHALNDEDREALTALAMTKEEYRRYIFPGLEIGKVEQWQKAYDFVWGTVHDRSGYKLTSILRKYGGQQLEYIGMRVTETAPWHLDCIVHKNAFITIKDAHGTETEVELFAGMAEINNQFKIICFDIERL